jgi:hypothetical protein
MRKGLAVGVLGRPDRLPSRFASGTGKTSYLWLPTVNAAVANVAVDQLANRPNQHPRLDRAVDRAVTVLDATVRDQRRLLNAYWSRRLPQQFRRSRWVESSGYLPGRNVDLPYPRSP